MPERAVVESDHPTHSEVVDAAVENDEAYFNSPTDPASSPIREHRDAFADGGEYVYDYDTGDTTNASKSSAKSSKSDKGE